MPGDEGEVQRTTSLKSIKVQKRKVQHNSFIDNTCNANSTSTTQLLNHASHLKKTHMNEMRKRRRDLLKRINYSSTFSVVLLPLFALIYIFQFSESIVPQNSNTFIFSCIYYNVTLLAFTSGYHKCFTHNSFRVRYRFLRFYFAIVGTSIGLGSIRVWASLHRAHHQFTDDTERDPYSIKRGFTWAHWGWLIKKPKIITFYEEFIEQEFPKNVESKKIINEIQDDVDCELDELEILENDYDSQIHELILWQDKYYFSLFILTAIVIPALITVFVCHDNFLNGVLYPGILRMFFCQQSVLSTESICHLNNIQVSIPTQPFNDKNSSQNCNNPLISLLTYGQSQQNYHHEFPHDYRCASSIFAFDPTKWFIWTLAQVGLVDELCRTPKDLITQLRIQQQQQAINRLKSQLNWGTPISKLPLITPKDFKKIISTSSNKDRIYIVIQNIIHDITPFMDQHPGGVPLLKASHGKDATKAFYGGVYGHSTAAVNLLATMRIGVLDVGNDEEVWKRVVREEGEVIESDSRSQTKSYRTAEAA